MSWGWEEGQNSKLLRPWNTEGSWKGQVKVRKRSQDETSIIMMAVFLISPQYFLIISRGVRLCLVHGTLLPGLCPEEHKMENLKSTEPWVKCQLQALSELHHCSAVIKLEALYLLRHYCLILSVCSRRWFPFSHLSPVSRQCLTNFQEAVFFYNFFFFKWKADAEKKLFKV